MELVGGRGKSQKELRVRECAVTVFEVVLNLAAWESAPNPGGISVKDSGYSFLGGKLRFIFLFKVVTHFWRRFKRNSRKECVEKKDRTKTHANIVK